MPGDWGSLFSLIKRIQTEYPDLAYLLDDDEVGPLLLRAVNGGMDSNEFQYKLRQTNWWRTTSGPARNWDAFSQLDPATARAQVAQRRTAIAGQAATMGVDLTIQGAHWIAVTALREGWDEDQIARAIARQATWQGHDDLPGGQLGAAFDQYRTMARDFGIKLTGRDAFRMARKTLVGRQTAEGVESELRHQAMQRFAGNQSIVNALKNGASLREFFAPLQNEIASAWEVTPDQVDIVNMPRFADILSHADDSGNTRPMTITEAIRWARQQPEWGATKQARDEGMGLVNSLLQMFGEV